jgi:hypothetical protein
LKASLPVAIDTGKLEAESSGDVGHLYGQYTHPELLRSITMTLDAKAMSPSYVRFNEKPHAGR